jgi:anti-anti-sigma factor
VSLNEMFSPPGAGAFAFEEHPMSVTARPTTLHIVRQPGEFGPIVRCYGDLTVSTTEMLRRELALLEPVGHPVLMLDLSHCSSLDVEGILAIVDSFKRLRRNDGLLFLVTGAGRAAQLLHATGIDYVVPAFPTEESALLALRGGGPPIPAPPTWQAARAMTLGRWRMILSMLHGASNEQVLLELTSMTPLCDRAEELYREHAYPEEVRCEFCPLFRALGGTPKEVGCESALRPMIEALRAGDRETARARVSELIRTIEELPLASEPEQAAKARWGYLPIDVR